MFLDAKKPEVEPKKAQNNGPVFDLEKEKEATIQLHVQNEQIKDRVEDTEFEGAPKPTEEEAAQEVTRRIEELRTFLQNQK